MEVDTEEKSGSPPETIVHLADHARLEVPMTTARAIALDPVSARCGRCDGLAWLPDYDGLVCGACGGRPGDRYLNRDGKSRRSLREANWDKQFESYLIPDPPKKETNAMPFPKLGFDPYKEIEGGPVVGVPYQAPLMMPWTYNCRFCGEHFRSGDYFELEESGGFVHQISDGIRGCGFEFEVQADS